MNDLWPKHWDGLTHEERRDDLLGAMLRMPPAVNASYKGKSIRPPKAKKRPKLDKSPPKGYQIGAEDSLLGDLSKLVKHMRPEWREELLQNLAVAVLSGKLTLDACRHTDVIVKYLKQITNAAMQDRYRNVALQTKAHRDDALSIGESLVGDEDVQMDDG